MQQSLFRVVCSQLLIVTLSVLPFSARFAGAQEQVRIPTSSLPGDVEDASAIESVLSQGRVLEKEQRWPEALSHYDAALKKYPQHTDLQRRQTLAEIHCELDRRFADSSFANLVRTTDERRALEAFDEVVLKIQTHYVVEPDWQKLTWRGTANLDVALTKPTFVKINAPQASSDQINAFRHELRDSVNTRIVRDRRAARDLVYYSARLAQQRLGIPLSATIMEYCCGAIGSLDQYSSYLSGSQLDEVYSQIEGNFVGLGIELKSDQGSLLIVDVIGNGPAALAGIQPGDRIVAVDGKSTEDITTELAADMLKGEQGSVVQVAVLSPANDAPRELSIRRERVDVPSVEDAMMVDKQNGVAYFRLTSFQKTTSRDVDAALWKLHREGMKSLIIDLRGNPGGLLTASVEVSDKFLTEGTIVSTRGRSRQEDFDYTAHRVGTWQVPLVVLIDRDTASASEIFAGAMRDHHRARVVGEQSYGKGSVQGIFPLSVVKSGVRLTTAKFYSPSGQAISGQGVTPDMAVAGSDVTATAHIVGYRGGTPDIVNDNVLAAGCEAARQLTVAQR